MIKMKIIETPAFDVIGKKTWISGQDNNMFGQFWAQCRQERLFDEFEQLRQGQVGSRSKGLLLGISCVEKDPSDRAFHYMIAIEKPETYTEELETYHVPAAQWAVFECIGKVPEAIVKSEIHAFTEWLPASVYEHAKAPEMEVYFPGNDGTGENNYCEFWLPITPKNEG